jgi:hypothetical protein
VSTGAQSRKHFTQEGSCSLHVCYTVSPVSLHTAALKCWDQNHSSAGCDMLVVLEAGWEGGVCDS